MRALVVEDNSQIRQVIVDLLTRRGHDVADFGDAESAWEVVQNTIFDLTVLDWNLPGLDGIDLCRRLRSRPGGAVGAILMLTGRSEPDDVELVVAAGADDYLTKPFKLDWLDIRIAFAERKVADLAERAQTAEALQQSEARFRSLVQHASDMIVVIDGDGRRTYASPVMERAVGAAPGGLIGTNLFETPWMDDAAQSSVIAFFQRALAHPGTTVTNEITINAVDGSRRRLEVQATNLIDNPNVRGIVFNSRDITERRLAEDLLRAAETRYRMLVEQIPAVAYIRRSDGDRATTYISPRIQSVLGYPAEAYLADPDLWASTLHPDDRERVLTADANGSLSGEPFRIEYRQRHSAGHYLWVRNQGELVPDASGCRHWQGVFIDITEEREAANALRQSEQRQRSLLASAERQATELRLLHEVRTALSKQMDLPAIFQTVVDAVARSFGYTFVSAYLREGDELVLQHQVGYPEYIGRFSISQGVAGRVVQTGVPILLENGNSDPDVLVAYQGMCSEVCVPLRDDGRPVGVLILETLEGTPLGTADLALMIALAEHVDAAIARARLYTAARESEARYRTVVEHVQEVIFQIDAEGNWTFLNPAWAEITGHEVADSLGRSAASFVHLSDRERFLTELQRLTPGDGERNRFEVAFLTATWGVRWLELHARTRRDATTGQMGIAGTLTDVTDRRRAEEALRESQARYRHLALHDALTGLPNRTLFLDRLEAAVLASALYQRDLAVLFIDLDGFKLVNDHLGHDVGDRLLERVGKRLLAALKPSDVVARLGGDEFAVLLEEDVDHNRAMAVAQHLLQVMQEPFALDGKELAIGMSVGIALGSGKATSPGDLLRNADVALYEAKGAGRATAIIHEPPAPMVSTLAPADPTRPIRSRFEDLLERRSGRHRGQQLGDRRTYGTETLRPLPTVARVSEREDAVILRD